MKKGFFRKAFIFFVIFLFIGAGIQPVFAKIFIESEKSELVELTIQICEVDKAYNNTVVLTQIQVEELESLINNFKDKIDSSDNLDETKEIFKSTIISLNELGLIPKDLSIEDAQNLVTGRKQDPRIIKILEEWCSKHQGFLDGINILCLIAGSSSNTYFQAPIGRIIIGISEFMFRLFENFNLLFLLFYPFYNICFWILYIGSFIWNFNPPKLIPNFEFDRHPARSQNNIYYKNNHGTTGNSDILGTNIRCKKIHRDIFFDFLYSYPDLTRTLLNYPIKFFITL